MSKYELMIVNRGVAYFPSVIEPIQFHDTLRGAPSKLTFKVVKGQEIDFQEGNPVRLKYDGKEIFFGFVFIKKRDREHHIEVTAYDQIRYLMFKDTMVFENKSATDIINHIGKVNPSLNFGTIEDTKFKLKSRVEDNTTYLDMIYNSLDHTLLQTKQMYVLYDDFGRLQLRNMKDLVIEDFIISEDNSENFSYISSIDDETYNMIKLIYHDKDTNEVTEYSAKDENSINRWGMLQHFEKIDEYTNGQLKADTLLELYNRKTRKLEVQNIRGNTDVRAGFRVMTMLNLGDIIIQNYLVVDSVTHKFYNSHHDMTIKFRGGGFVG